MKRHQHKRTNAPLKRVATLSKGKISRRVIAEVVDGNRQYTLHSTKGYRSTKI